MKPLLSNTLIALTLLSTLPIWAQAPSNKNEFTALLKQGKTAEAEALARDRYNKNSKDDVALLYWANVVANDSKKRDELIPKLEQCIKDLPQSARCHYALGALYGVVAQTAGIVGGIKYASSIKESFLKAVELDPLFFDARQALNQFYLQAPGIAGGSVRKAIDNVESLTKLSPAQGALLRVNVHLYEKEFDKAEALLNSLKDSKDELVIEKLPTLWAGLAYALINDNKLAKAQQMSEALLSTYMNNALIYAALARAQLENKLFDAAIASYERVMQIDANLNIYYRLGLAYQAKGEKQKAVTALQKFLTFQSTGKVADDARSRVETLTKL